VVLPVSPRPATRPPAEDGATPAPAAASADGASPTANDPRTAGAPTGEPEPPKRTLSLVDELFGPPVDDDDETLQLPRVRDER